ncbi:hypothetical protein HDU79_008493 [Rhizoclosmatium sp. JEL0117]|nr:hypothetical protein HDU79_008493 [Rhizoclosmatium sp. JEL0117]
MSSTTTDQQQQQQQVLAQATDSTTSLTQSGAGTPTTTTDSIPSTPKRKVKCDFGCGQPIVKTIGTCRYCSAQYCAKHRLPEAHACANMQSCQSAAKDRLEKRLIGEKTVGAKVATA